MNEQKHPIQSPGYFLERQPDPELYGPAIGHHHQVCKQTAQYKSVAMQSNYAKHVTKKGLPVKPG